jgi:hypothetical protein
LYSTEMFEWHFPQVLEMFALKIGEPASDAGLMS